jgi:hypothetical protein
MGFFDLGNNAQVHIGGFAQCGQRTSRVLVFGVEPADMAAHLLLGAFLIDHIITLQA